MSELVKDLFIANFRAVTGMSLSLICGGCGSRMVIASPDGYAPPKFACGPCGRVVDVMVTLQLANAEDSNGEKPEKPAGDAQGRAV